MKRINLKLLIGLLLGLVVLVGGVFALHRYQVVRNASGLAKLARAKLKDDKIGEALGLFGRYLGMRPDDVEVQREYAELVLSLAEGAKATTADLQRAYSSLEEAVRRNPEDDDLRLKLAEFLVRVGRFGDAREHLETLRTRIEEGTADRESLDAAKMQMLRARASAGEGNFDDAARLAGDLVGFDVQQRLFTADSQPLDATEPYILLASILEDRLGDAAAASTVYEELVKRRGEDKVAWLALARWHRLRKDLEAATQDMDNARAIAPDDGEVVWASFELALEKGDVAAAQTIVERARELFPDDERVYRGLAALAMQRNDMDAAETALQDGIDRLPERASLLLMLADTLLQRGKLEEAGETLSRIEDLYGAASPAMGLLKGRLLIAERRWPQARRLLEEIRPMAAGFKDLTRQIDLCLGQCYENLEEFDEQLDVSRRILVDDPTSLAARVTQASAMAAAGRPEDALTEFETVAAAIPSDRLPSTPQVWYPLIQLRIQDQLKRPAGERDWTRIEDLLAKLGESPSVSASQLTLLRADLLARKGEAEAAADLLERAVKAGNLEPQLWTALVGMTLRQKGPEAAREVLSRIPADRIDDPAFLPVRVQVAASTAPEQAARDLAEIESQTTDLPPEEAARILVALGGAWLDVGDTAAAERLWRAAAERRPDDLRSRNALLDMAMQGGDIDKARAMITEIETLTGPTNARVRVAQAGLKILEVRRAQEAKELELGKVTLTADEQRLLDEARSLLIEAENDRPGWPLIQTSFAEIDSLKGDTPGAIDRLQRAVRIGPAGPEVVRRLVSLLYASNRLDEARQAMESLGPDGLAGMERLSAEMELRSGRLEEAVAIAERSVRLDSKNGGELLWLGQLLERSGKSERAGELFAKAVEVSPDRADTWISLFAHQLATGRRRAAENTLERASQALTSPARELVAAEGAEMLGRLEDADRAFRDAAAAAPTDVSIATARAEFLVRVGKVDAAKQLLQDIIGAESDGAADRAMKAWARRKFAELTAERGTYPQLMAALAILEQNAAGDGRLAAEDAAVRVMLLANRAEPTSWRQAIETLERLRDQQPLTTAQRLMLAGLLDKVGRWDESRQEYMAVVAAPRTPPAFIAMLADKLISHGEIDASRSWVKRLQEVSPQAPVTLALQARLALADRDRTRLQDLVSRLMPTDDTAVQQVGQLAAMARLFEDLGFSQPADDVLKLYAARSPDGVIARAQFLGRDGRPDEALDVLEESWSRLPLDRLLAIAVEVVRLNPKATAAASRIEKLLVKARRIDPDTIVTDLVEAELLTLQERQAEAQARYRDLLTREDLDPTQRAIIANNLAFLLAEPKTATEARSLIDSAIDTLGPHPDLLDTRGLVRLALGEDREAVADLEQAVLEPTGVKFLHLAYAHLRNDDKSAARVTLEEGRKKGLATEKLSPADRTRLRELESELEVAPEQAGSDDARAGRG